MRCCYFLGFHILKTSCSVTFPPRRCKAGLFLCTCSLHSYPRPSPVFSRVRSSIIWSTLAPSCLDMMLRHISHVEKGDNLFSFEHDLHRIFFSRLCMCVCVLVHSPSTPVLSDRRILGVPFYHFPLETEPLTQSVVCVLFVSVG